MKSKKTHHFKIKDKKGVTLYNSSNAQRKDHAKGFPTKRKATTVGKKIVKALGIKADVE